MRHEYHLVLDDALADLNDVIRPALCLMDGTVGLEGDGPKSGWPRVANRILVINPSVYSFLRFSCLCFREYILNLCA